MNNTQEAADKNGRLDPEYRTVMRVYGAFAACLFMGIIPHVLFATLGMLLFTGVLIAAYGIRRRATPNGLAENHMTYIIRTMWIMSVVTAAAALVAGAYVISVYDPAPIHNCIQDILNGRLDNITTREEIYKPCVDDFVAANGRAFLIGGILSAGPVAIYFIYRLCKGLTRAMNGYRIADVKSWL